MKNIMASIDKKMATETVQMKKTDVEPKLSAPTGQDEYLTLDFRGLTLPWSILISMCIFTLGIGSAVYFGLKSIQLPAGTGTVTPTAAPEDYSAGAFGVGQVSASDNPAIGDKTKAKVVIVEFSDFVCPYCQKFHQEAFQDIKKNYIDTGKVALVYRHYPLNIHDPAASTAAKAAVCIDKLYGNGKFIEYHEAFFSNMNGLTQNAYDAQNNPVVNLKQGPFDSMISTLKLDNTKIKNCMTQAVTATKLSSDQNDFSALASQYAKDYPTKDPLGTPSFVIGIMDDKGVVHGRVVNGAYPYIAFQNIIEEQLKK